MARYELGDLVWKVTGDTKDFDKNLATSESKLSKFSTAAFNAGKKLTTFLTLPIAAAGVATVKAASDLGESLNAVNVVFGESAGIINNFGETAAESAGLSQSAFNGLATVIGAQLKQSGLAIDDVAQRTVELTQRSADLASVFNVDVTEATEALGAALRGESEPARRFGINISDAAVQAEALATGLVKSKKEITDQIKVQARYSLILKQSNDVANDFQNTVGNSLPNQLRVLKADLVNVSAELGEALIPIALDAVGVISDAVDTFGDLDDGTKKLILTIAGAAAAGGPILLFVGGIGKAITSINGAIAVIKTLNTTALFGPLGLIAGLGAATAALIAISNKRNQRGLDELADSMEGLKDSSTLTSDELGKFGDIISREISKGGKASFDELNDRVSDLAEELGISRNTIIDIGLESGKVVGQYKEQFKQIEGQREELENLKLIDDIRAEKAQFIKDRQAEMIPLIREELEEKKAIEAAAKKAEIAEEARLKGVIEARKLATENYQSEIDLIERKATLDLLTEQEVVEEKIELEKQFQEQLLEIGFDGLENAQGLLDIGDQQVLDSIERRKQFEKDLKEVEKSRLITVTDEYVKALTIRSQAADDFYNNLEKKEQDRQEKIEDTSEKYVDNFTSAFEQVGKALVEQEDAWAAVGAAALGTIAEVVRALGRQLAAEAAILYARAFFTGGATLPSAIGATIASAAAFTAAGAIEASSQGFQDGGFVQPVPGVSSSGDRVPARLNPGEVVLTQDDARELLSAIRGGNLGGQIVINNTLNTDSQKSMERAARQLYPYMQREAVRRG